MRNRWSSKRLEVSPKRLRFLPSEVRDMEPLIPPGTTLLIWQWDDVSHFGTEESNLIYFEGASDKPAAYRFKDPNARKTFVRKLISDAQARTKAKKDLRDSAKTELGTGVGGLKVGDIFVSSWGYEQTNIDFYMVTAVLNKSVMIEEIGKKIVSSRGSSDLVVPNPAERSRSPKRKIPSFSDGKPVIRLNSFSSAWLWDGQPRSQTAFGWGH